MKLDVSSIILHLGASYERVMMAFGNTRTLYEMELEFKSCMQKKTNGVTHFVTHKVIVLRCYLSTYFYHCLTRLRKSKVE